MVTNDFICPRAHFWLSHSHYRQVDLALAQLLLAQAAANVVKQTNPASHENREPVSRPQAPIYSAHSASLSNPAPRVEQSLLARQDQVASTLQAQAGSFMFNQTQASGGGRPNSNNFLEELKRTYEQHLAAHSADNGSSASDFIAHSTSTVAGNAARSSVGLQQTQYQPFPAGNGPPAAHFPSGTPVSLVGGLTTGFASNFTKPSSISGFIASQVASHAYSDNDTGKSPTCSMPTSKPAPSVVSKKAKTVKVRVTTEGTPRPTEDGAIMVGFLTALRSSFESAVAQQQEARDREQQEDSEETNSSASASGRRRPATVTDSSSQQQESCSSVDESDWNSEDKKTDPSSSEDSDKDDNQDGKQDKYQEAVPYSKGPPRKRHKSKKADEHVIESRAE